MHREAQGAILVSRQSLYPSGGDQWVQKALQAVRWVKRERMRLLVTVGMPTWDLLLALAVREGVWITLVLPFKEGQALSEQINSICKDFPLSLCQVAAKFVKPPLGMKRAAVCRMVDRSIFRSADIFLPVSIRPKGFWETELATGAAKGKRIDVRFQVPYDSTRKNLRREYDATEVNPRINRIGNEYLIHWTRGTSHPWPTERSLDYYLALADASRYPRSAFDTLAHIIQCRRIVASSRHMPLDVRCVSFSALSPAEVVPLMKWRSRYREMSFEPYGIGIRRATAERIGAKPVRYVNRRELGECVSSERWRYQSIGEKTDWRQEAEWRIPGDVSLNAITPDDLLVITGTEAEASLIEGKYRLRAISLFRQGRTVLRTGSRGRAAEEAVVY